VGVKKANFPFPGVEKCEKREKNAKKRAKRRPATKPRPENESGHRPAASGGVRVGMAKKQFAKCAGKFVKKARERWEKRSKNASRPLFDVEL
jgi:hypothetical protein